MRFRTVLAFVFVLLLTTTAQGQTKISGTAQCGKPDQQHMIEVGDRPNHAFVIGRVQCTWTKPVEIGGATTKEFTNTNFTEMMGKRTRERGVVVEKLAEGEFYVRYQGAANVTEAGPAPEGKWSFAGGTGKFKGLKGRGTYKCKPTADGSTCEIEGEYTLP